MHCPWGEETLADMRGNDEEVSKSVIPHDLDRQLASSFPYPSYHYTFDQLEPGFPG
jgi:hypothetical protein